jgi:RNA polymerase sigma-70 factor (ECF subfamily)
MEDAMPAFVLQAEAEDSAPLSEPHAHPGDDSDEQVMMTCAAGDAAAFDILFTRYRQPIYGFFRRRLADPAIAEELAQETFLVVLRAAARYRQSALFRTWLYAIAFKILHAHHRKAAFRATFQGAPAEVPEPAASGNVDTAVMMRLAVGKLDKPDREVLLLREFEQLSYAEIGELLNLPLNTVRSRLFRARTALHHLLAAPAAAGKERI